MAPQAFADTTLVVGKAAATADSIIAVDVGDKMGFFKKHGIDVKIIDFTGGGKMTQAMATLKRSFIDLHLLDTPPDMSKLYDEVSTEDARHRRIALRLEDRPHAYYSEADPHAGDYALAAHARDRVRACRRQRVARQAGDDHDAPAGRRSVAHPLFRERRAGLR